MWDLQNKVQTANQTIEFIDDQINDIQDSLYLYEGDLEQFKTENKGNLSGDVERALSRLQQLEQTKTEILVRQNYFDYLFEYIKDGQKLDQAILPSSVGVADPILTTMVSNMIQLQLEAKSHGLRENPLVQDLLSQIEDIRHNIIEIVTNLKATDEINLSQINRQLTVIESELQSLPGAERILIGLERSFSLSENLFIFLSQKNYEAKISKASATTDIEVVNPAMLESGPVSPDVDRNYIVSVVAGLGIPIAIIFLIQALNNRIQSKEDIERLTDIPIIAGVGHNKLDSNLVVQTKPKSAVAESFRSLRSNLNYFTSDEQKN